ncbi:hypothetical protein ACFLRF_02280 [Candidatus Altiarchaeota archaeon]
MRAEHVLILLTLFLGGCLTGEVEEIEPPAMTTSSTLMPTTTVPKVVYTVYTDPHNGLRMKHPVDWNLEEEYLGYVLVFHTPLDDFNDEFIENVNVVTDKHEGFIPTLDEFRRESKKAYRERLERFNQLEVTEVNVNGHRVIRHVLSYYIENLSLKAMQYVFFIGEDSFVLTYTAQATRYFDYLDIAEEMFRSFDKSVSLHARTDKKVYRPGEEVLLTLVNTGLSSALIRDDLCRKPALKLLDANETLLIYRRPSCDCTEGERELLVNSSESITYPFYMEPGSGWNQTFYDIIFFNVLCQDPSYLESLNIDGNQYTSMFGDYYLEISYQGTGTNNTVYGDTFTSRTGFSIKPVPTTTTIPKTIFFDSPRNRDNITLTEYTEYINVTIFNNQKGGFLSLTPKAQDMDGEEFRIVPFSVHINSFEKKTVKLYVNHYSVHAGDNITLTLGDDYNKSIMITLRKDVVTKTYGGFPGMPLFDPLSDQKKYQHGKISPWD